MTEEEINRALEHFPDDEPELQPINGRAYTGQRFDVASFLRSHGVQFREQAIAEGTRYLLSECVFDPSHKGKDAAVFVYSNGAIGYHCFHNSCQGRKWKDVRQALDPSCYDRQRQQSYQSNGQTQDEEPIKYERITAADLDAATYKLEYLIDGVLVGAQPQIVAGGKKCLKTNLLCDATISLATGLDFLGKFRVGRTVRTAFMSGESGLHTIQETCRRICRSKEIDLSEIDGLIFSPDLPRIDDPRHQQALEQFITDDSIEVLVLDPAYLCLPGGDAGNLFIQGEMLRNLAAICQAKGATLLLCHHTRKGGIADPFEPPELEHIAWAGFQEFARGWWLVGRREKYEPGTGKHKLWLNVGGSAGHSSLWGLDIEEGVYEPGRPRIWRVNVMTAADARDAAQEQVEGGKQAKVQRQLGQDVKALVEAAMKHPDGETKNILKTEAALSGARATLAIASALKSGKLVACEVQKLDRKTPREGYKPGPNAYRSDRSD